MGKHSIRFFPGLLKISVYKGSEEAFDNYLINDNGNKLFYEVNKFDSQKKLKKKNGKYITDKIMINISKLCWSSENIPEQYLFRVEYYDPKSERTFYSSFKRVKVIK
jgi:hypothetical protein